MKKACAKSHAFDGASRALCIAVLAALSACGGEQSALHPRGVEAAFVAHLSWIMFVGAALVLLLVTGILLYSLYRRPDKRADISGAKLIFAGGVALPVVSLTLLLAYTLTGTKELRASEEPGEHDIEIVGHRWWWQVNYLGPEPEHRFTTANELHLPRGKRVRVKVTTADVIHSFWVPALAGKIDMIPGHENELVLEPTEVGVFRGQCAEYCGAQHTRMALYVVVHEPGEFDAWRERESAPAVMPVDPLARAGYEVFMGAACVYCHRIRGTPAQGTFGPDLTHIGSRSSIAAGTLAANRANLTAWIVHAQQIKPGSLMPSLNVLTGEELRALSAYLESLE